MALRELNDDCLLYLFRYLEPEDLLALEDVSNRLCSLAFQYYRLCRYYVWSKARQKVNKKMIERIGFNLRKIVYQGMGNTDFECFDAVNCYCQRIESITLCDVTIDFNLGRLLMPVLENLQHLHIDRYLMIKKVRVEGPLNEGEELPEDDAEDVLTDIQCLMLCCQNLKHLFIGEPFDKDSFMSHEYLETLLNLETLNLNLTRNVSFREFGEYFGHTFLPLSTLELIFPNDGVTDYDLFCKGLEELKQLKVLNLHNLQNKHFFLLIPGIRKVASLQQLQLNCAQGVILSKSVQQQMSRIDNKMLQDVMISSLKNTSFKFMWTFKLWSNLRSFEISSCDKFKNEDLLEICSRVTNKFSSITVRDCGSLTPEIVHLLVRISKLRKYHLTFYFYHANQETMSRFEKETVRTIIKNINVKNFLAQ